MDKRIPEEELFFINTFVRQNRRERLTFELSTTKKRSNCIWRFAHMARGYLRLEMINSTLYKKGKLMTKTEDLIDKHQRDNVYIIHFDASMDKKTLNFVCAIDMYLGKGPYIMIDCNRTPVSKIDTYGKDN